MPQARRGLVLGCGGTVGGAWTVGALAAVARALDWDPRSADVIVGTSSGSSIAALLGSGVSAVELVAAQRGEASAPAAARDFFTEPPRPAPSLPGVRLTGVGLAAHGLRRRAPLIALSGLSPAGRTDAAFLERLATELAPAGWVEHPATWLVSADARTGRRVPFGSHTAARVTLGEALRASWAVPGWYPPVAMAGGRYVDGGIVSPSSADLVADLELDELVLIAPMASLGDDRAPGVGGHVERLMRSPMSAIVDAEVALLEARGTQVLRVHPTRRDLAATGWNFMDPSRRIAALDAGLRSVADRLHVTERSTNA